MRLFKITDDLGRVHGTCKAETPDQAIDLYLSESRIGGKMNQSLRSIIKAEARL